VQFVKPEPLPERKAQQIEVAGWPFDAAEAKKRQAAAGAESKLKVDLAQGVAMDMVLIPAGSFVMGDANGAVDEFPLTAVKIEQPFFMGACEISNEQYAAFDPAHDSAYISEFKKDQSSRGQAVNQSKQPVIRVSWANALAFCDWLSKKSGRKFTLPTEAQWEYACRAGTATALNYGDVGTDFGKFANLADQRALSICRGDPQWLPCVSTVNDGASVTTNITQYLPNAWGLLCMHGNVAEWTLTTYKPYPYDAADGRDKATTDGDKVVRGGSFYDRPERARSAFRLSYRPYQKVFNVGFRVVCGVAPEGHTSIQPPATGAQTSTAMVPTPAK
jgi:formylglycine-generating enzyme required for sulfatase activity